GETVAQRGFSLEAFLNVEQRHGLVVGDLRMAGDLRGGTRECLGEVGEALGTDADRGARNDTTGIHTGGAGGDHRTVELGAFVEMPALDHLDVGAWQPQCETVRDGHPRRDPALVGSAGGVLTLADGIAATESENLRDSAIVMARVLQ